jgi:hypothetical protein
MDSKIDDLSCPYALYPGIGFEGDKSEEEKKDSNDVTDPNTMVVLNVGGERFTTTMGTLLPKAGEDLNYFNGMVSWATKDNEKQKYHEYFIDRDGKVFGHLLNLMRGQIAHLQCIKPDEMDMLIDDATYFGITMIQKRLLQMRDNSENQTQQEEEQQQRQLSTQMTIPYHLKVLLHTGDNVTGADIPSGNLHTRHPLRHTIYFHTPIILRRLKLTGKHMLVRITEAQSSSSMAVNDNPLVSVFVSPITDSTSAGGRVGAGGFHIDQVVHTDPNMNTWTFQTFVDCMRSQIMLDVDLTKTGDELTVNGLSIYSTAGLEGFFFADIEARVERRRHIS